jgi:hypothetical protein
MRVALHDGDETKYPNLALMKLSAWHLGRGDTVSWYNPLKVGTYDKVYSSKVFTWSTQNAYLQEETERGGIGYGCHDWLPDNVEHHCPDYRLYGIDHSLGFLTRGCPGKCGWCFVPEKEGEIRPHADVEEFACHRDVVLMDNNVLAHPYGVEQIEKMTRMGLRVDFNQGLDARLIDDGIARRLAALKWLAPLRLACDSFGQMDAVGKAVELLRWHNCTPRRYFCYVLVGDVGDAVERVRYLKGIDVDPFAQPYRDKAGTAATKEQRDFARWVNHKAEFKSRTWGEYQEAKARR